MADFCTRGTCYNLQHILCMKSFNEIILYTIPSTPTLAPFIRVANAHRPSHQPTGYKSTM